MEGSPANPQSVSSQSRGLVAQMPGQMSPGSNVFPLAAAAVLVVVLALRLFQLDTLQQEVYGDIQIILKYVDNILAGTWPFYFDLSSGPLYHYLMAPLVWVYGPSYLTLKIGSVIVSLCVLAVTFLFARRLHGGWFALLATFITGTSSWLLVFSRLGNSQILLPLLAIGTLYMTLVVVERGHTRDYIGCAVVSALGLYCYPQSFILPGVVAVTLLSLKLAGHPVTRRGALVFVFATGVMSVPFLLMMARDLPGFVDGYVGGKLRPDGDLGAILLANIAHGLGAFNIHGDLVFRSNPPGLPHLDFLSGLLQLVGIAYWLGPSRRRYAPLLLLPFLLLQIPSILVLSEPREVPSASRTLAIVPICGVFVASGIYWLSEWLGTYSAKFGIASATSVALFISVANADRYWGQYITSLPYQDTPLGLLVARYADRLAPDVGVHVVGCCWRDGMPETLYVKTMSKMSSRIEELHSDVSCEELEALPRPAVLIWSPDKEFPNDNLDLCSAQFRPELISTESGLALFRASPLDTKSNELTN